MEKQAKVGIASFAALVAVFGLVKILNNEPIFEKETPDDPIGNMLFPQYEQTPTPTETIQSKYSQKSASEYYCLNRLRVV